MSWSRTWEALARQSPLPQRDVQRHLTEFFQAMCRLIEPTVVLEIGAHEATFSRWAAESFPDARVMAFEANPYVSELYAPELARSRVDYRNLAVGEVTGEVQLNLPTVIAGRKRELTSRMASLSAHTQAEDHVTINVPAVRLEDHLSLEPTDTGVAWIDVEGASEAVLRGSESLLDRVQAIFIEVEKRTTWEGQWLDTDVNRFLHAGRFRAGRPRRLPQEPVPPVQRRLRPSAHRPAPANSAPCCPGADVRSSHGSPVTVAENRGTGAAR